MPPLRPQNRNLQYCLKAGLTAGKQLCLRFAGSKFTSRTNEDKKCTNEVWKTRANKEFLLYYYQVFHPKTAHFNAVLFVPKQTKKKIPENPQERYLFPLISSFDQNDFTKRCNESFFHTFSLQWNHRHACDLT